MHQPLTIAAAVVSVNCIANVGEVDLRCWLVERGPVYMISCVCRVRRARLKSSGCKDDVFKVTGRKTSKEYDNGEGAHHREE